MTEYVEKTSREIKITDKDMHPSRQALHYALNVLDSGSRVVVLQHFASKHGISIYADTSEISRQVVSTALVDFFGAGGDLLMKRYDKYLDMSEELRLTVLGFMA